MSITQAEADASKAAFGAQIDLLVTGAPTGESPTGTWLPPAAAITDSHGDKWTLDVTPQPPYGFKIMRNGIWISGIAQQLAYCGGKILCYNGQGYFNWNGTTWIVQSAPFCPRTN